MKHILVVAYLSHDVFYVLVISAHVQGVRGGILLWGRSIFHLK